MINICKKCGASENDTEMYKWKKKWCKPCFKKDKNEREKRYYWANVEEVREKKRIAAKSEKQQIYRKNYKQNNEKYKQWCKEYAKSTQVAIRGTLSTRIRTLLAKKHKSTTEYLGCTVNYFMKWLESQFDESMSWDNHGSYWVIDHVKPCKAYDLTVDAQASECFHWKNMRPLEKTENAEKCDKVLPDVIARHRILADKYENENADDKYDEGNSDDNEEKV